MRPSTINRTWHSIDNRCKGGYPRLVGCNGIIIDSWVRCFSIGNMNESCIDGSLEYPNFLCRWKTSFSSSGREWNKQKVSRELYLLHDDLIQSLLLANRKDYWRGFEKQPMSDYKRWMQRALYTCILGITVMRIMKSSLIKLHGKWIMVMIHSSKPSNII